MSSDPNCIFCKIIEGKIPSKKVYEAVRYRRDPFRVSEVMADTKLSRQHTLLQLRWLQKQGLVRQVGKKIPLTFATVE